jgi:mannose-6-phosphate isomerase-like protein (cupin superfamily)
MRPLDKNSNCRPRNGRTEEKTVKTIATAALLAALASTALAQAPAAPVPRPTEPPSNIQAKVNIDRFIGDASKSPSTVAYDAIMRQRILDAGDPQKPGDPGSVLLRRKSISLDTLQAGETTSLQKFDDQQVFYIESGEGTLDDGRQSWVIRANTMILVPPNLVHRFHAAGATPLKMINVDIPVEPGVTPKSAIIVRDVTKMVQTERNVHWNNMSKYVFLGDQDGLHPGDRIYLVYLTPMTIAGAHAHSPGQEEVWIKVTDGATVMQLGSEIRNWPINSGFLAPPNGQTVHAAMNLGDKMEAWLYIARLNPDAKPGMIGVVNPNRPPPPPGIAEGLANSNVVPTPLPGMATKPARK